MSTLQLDDRDGVIERIRIEMVKKKLDAQNLAKKAGLGKSTISRFLGNRGGLRPESLQKIADALGVTRYFLMFGEEEVCSPRIQALAEELAEDDSKYLYESREDIEEEYDDEYEDEEGEEETDEGDDFIPLTDSNEENPFDVKDEGADESGKNGESKMKESSGNGTPIVNVTHRSNSLPVVFSPIGKEPPVGNTNNIETEFSIRGYQPNVYCTLVNIINKCADDLTDGDRLSLIRILLEQE